MLQGRPGVGKTTLVQRVLPLLASAGTRVAGFATAEIRVGGRRVGFAAEDVAGRREVIAWAGHASLVSVGRYGVDLAAFERVALPTLTDRHAQVIVIDELGRMELASEPFRIAVLDLMATDKAVLATVHAARHPFTDALKSRRDVRVLEVTPDNRDALPSQVAASLLDSWPMTAL
jgi:nucleoside-triphosphatase